MKNVLFISTRDYNLDAHDQTLEKKFSGLGRGMNVFVLARGRGIGEQYGAKFFLIPKIGTVFWMMAAVWQGRKIIRREKIDVIISQAPLFDGLSAIVLKLLTGVETIVEVHSDWINSLFLQHRLPFPPLLKFIFRKWGGFVLSRADKVRVVSSSLRQAVLLNSRPKKIYQFPAFTDLEIFLNEDNASYEPVVVYAGWLYPLKGVDVLIKAFGALKAEYPEYQLEIIGSGPSRADLEKLVKDSRIKSVEFTGQLGQGEVKERIKRSACLVLPSYSEGLPRVLLEAAALKKPLIGSAVGGIPEVIDDGVNGYLFAPGNADELARALMKIASDKGLMISLGEAGRRLVEQKYSMEQYFAGYFDMIKNIPHPPTPSPK